MKNINSVSRLAFAMLLSLAYPATTFASPPVPPGDARYWDGYHAALLELRQGKWNEAIATLTKTEEFARGDRRLRMARGVAYVLLQDYAKATADLTYAKSNESREPQLWIHAIEAMSLDLRIGGNIAPDPNPRRGAPRKWFMGVPGHVVQGGKDYTTDYASFIIYDMAMPYRQTLESEKKVNEPAFLKIKQAAGRYFANRTLATGELSSRNFALAAKLMQQGSMLEAREMLDFAQAPYPFDAEMAALCGDLWLRVGRPATARNQYTRALTINPLIASAYAGRAQAAAMMGDASRARTDLAQAKAYGHESSVHSALVEATLKTSVANGNPESLIAEMDKAAASGATVEALLHQAIELHRVVSGKRLRYDEIYQDTIRKLNDLILAQPANVEAKLDLAQYLFDESENRGENVETRRGRVTYRWQHSRSMELNRAYFYAEKAYQQDNRSSRALLLKAMILLEMGNANAAAKLVDDAVRATGLGEPVAVRMLAEFRRRQIGSMLQSAAALRTPTFTTSSHDEHRSDGVYRVTTTTRYDPSASDLARAAQLEAAAKQLMQQTRTIMEQAINLSRGSVDGYLLEASYQNWFGTSAKALELLQECVKKFPSLMKSHDAMVAQLRSMGRKDEALEAEAVSFQLLHTTAGPLLSRIWMNVDREGFGPMIAIINRARQLDPTDPRTTIYLAQAERDLGEKEKAAQYLTVAAALETARLQIDDVGEAKQWSRRADDMATLMATHNLLGMAAAHFNKPDEEIKHHEATMAMLKRFGPDGRKTPMFGAVFVQRGMNQVPVPATPNGATIAAQACVEGGKWYQARHRTADAQRCWQMATDLGRPPRTDAFPNRYLRPNIGNAQGDTNFSGFAGQPAAIAMIELAKIEITRRNFKTAHELLQDAMEMKPPREMIPEIQAMFKTVLEELYR